VKIRILHQNPDLPTMKHSSMAKLMTSITTTTMTMIALMMLINVHASVIDFQEYTGTQLSAGTTHPQHTNSFIESFFTYCYFHLGPHLTIDDYAFTRSPLGGVRDVTVECWIFLRDW
jgi:hypothetical protein